MSKINIYYISSFGSSFYMGVKLGLSH